MHRFKLAGLATVSAAVLLCVPSAPASAAGPLLFAPWVLGHVLRAAALPFVAAAAAASASESYGAPPGTYATPGYYGPGYGQPPLYSGPPAYYPPPAYSAPPVAYYPPAPQYYGAPAYYGPAYGRYGRSVTGYYAPQRGYAAAPRMRYAPSYGAQVRYGSRGSYRRR